MSLTGPARRLARGRPQGVSVEFLRALIVGGIATGIDVGVLVVLVDGLGLHYLKANAFSYAVGTVANYVLSIRWVFGVRVMQNRAMEFGIFALSGAAGLAISQSAMYVFAGSLHWHYTIAKILSVSCHFLWNFWSRKLLLFHGKSARKDWVVSQGP
ncbi:MAG: GtrA family protein [Deltaproteobacteria bacterium]|nr:GtrA family protein [Deltaproteobacteria bacterium]